MVFKPREEYDDVYEAIDLQILVSGLSKKEIAASVFPGRTIETAKSLFSRALSPENTDVYLRIEYLLAIMDLAGAEHVINYLCDRYDFHRPSQRDPQADTLEKSAQVKHLLIQVDEITARLKFLMRKDR